VTAASSVPGNAKIDRFSSDSAAYLRWKYTVEGGSTSDTVAKCPYFVTYRKKRIIGYY
jgi:hypothetical protein